MINSNQGAVNCELEAGPWLEIETSKWITRLGQFQRAHVSALIKMALFLNKLGQVLFSI